MKSIRLIPNWRDAHAFASVRVAGIGGLLSFAGAIKYAWEQTPADWRSQVPTWAILAMFTVVFVITIVVRVIDQSQPAPAAAPAVPVAPPAGGANG